MESMNQCICELVGKSINESVIRGMERVDEWMDG